MEVGDGKSAEDVEVADRVAVVDGTVVGRIPGKRRRRWRKVVIVMVSVAVGGIGGLAVLGGGGGVARSSGFVRRRLTTLGIGGYIHEISWHTAEGLTTTDGVVPSVTCPAGKYRPSAAFDSNYRRRVGFRSEGCRDCPRGRYGNIPGLTDEYCTQDCPIGRYRDIPGAADEEECHLCPPGVYGDERGLTTKECSGACPAGKYSDVWGLDEKQGCKFCPENYRGWACSWEVVAQHLDNDRNHNYDLDTKPSLKLRRSPVNFRKGTNIPRPIDLENPFVIPLINDATNEVPRGS